MKAHFRQYPGDLIPVCRWKSNYEHRRAKVVGDSFYMHDEDSYNDLDKIVFAIFDFLHPLVRPINTWWREDRTKHYIKVENEDVWDASETLAHVIVPVLKKLKEVKHGSPHVKLEDVPDDLKPESGVLMDKNGNVDDLHHKRWEWVLDEMIWAFEQELIDWQNLYCHNSRQLGLEFVPKEGTTNSTIKFNYQKDPTKPPYYRDRDGEKAHYARMKNGRLLFAKYYHGLWD
jgi:hypothetical protein